MSAPSWQAFEPRESIAFGSTIDAISIDSLRTKERSFHSKLIRFLWDEQEGSPLYFTLMTKQRSSCWFEKQANWALVISPAVRPLVAVILRQLAPRHQTLRCPV
jgi:hypothetical protein